MLEWKRFVTLSYRKFQKLQIDHPSPYAHAGSWITHNFMGWFDGLDHYEMSADLDMASWDWYVGTGHNDPYFSNSSARSDPRLQAQKFLGDGDSTRLRQLVAHQ